MVTADPTMGSFVSESTTVPVTVCDFITPTPIKRRAVIVIICFLFPVIILSYYYNLLQSYNFF